MITFILRPTISAILALLVYGGWAALSNTDFGFFVALKAFCAQGGYAFLATLFVGSAATVLYLKLGETIRAIFFSFLICLFFMIALPFGLHSLAKTPNIFLSMLPGLLWGSGYLAAILWSHHRKSTL